MNCEAIAVPRRMLAIPRLKMPLMKPWRKWNKPRVVGDLSGNLKLKNVTQANGSTLNPQPSAGFSTIPEMTLTITPSGKNNVYLSFVMPVFAPTGSTVSGAIFQFFKDGAGIGSQYTVTLQENASNNTGCTVTMTFIDSLPTNASHTYTVQWKTGTGGTITGSSSNRTFQAVELG